MPDVPIASAWLDAVLSLVLAAGELGSKRFVDRPLGVGQLLYPQLQVRGYPSCQLSSEGFAAKAARRPAFGDSPGPESSRCFVPLLGAAPTMLCSDHRRLQVLGRAQFLVLLPGDAPSDAEAPRKDAIDLGGGGASEPAGVQQLGERPTTRAAPRLVHEQGRIDQVRDGPYGPVGMSSAMQLGCMLEGHEHKSLSTDRVTVQMLPQDPIETFGGTDRPREPGPVHPVVFNQLPRKSDLRQQLEKVSLKLVGRLPQ